MESVYLETTFISYLVARPSRDLLVAAHQQTTQDWWENRRSQFECSVSQVVIDEVTAGDPAEVQKRLAIIASLPTLEVTEDAESLTQAIMAAGILPPHAFPDAAQVARRIDGSIAMWEDPIVAEVHRAREKLAAQLNFDVGAFFAGIRKRQASLGNRLVPQKKRTEPTAEADRGRQAGSAGSTPSEAAPAA